jgi:hypothetical protein
MKKVTCVTFLCLAVWPNIARSSETAAKKPDSRIEKRARARIFLPFMMLFGPDHTGGIGTEPGLQVEIYDHHIILFTGMLSVGPGAGYGGGAGYAYEWVLVRNVLRLEVGAVAGYFYFDGGCESDKDYVNYLLLRTTLHGGYKYFFVSVGPRLYLGETLVGGFVLGLTLRI